MAQGTRGQGSLTGMQVAGRPAQNNQLRFEGWAFLPWDLESTSAAGGNSKGKVNESIRPDQWLCVQRCKTPVTEDRLTRVLREGRFVSGQMQTARPTLATTSHAPNQAATTWIRAAEKQELLSLLSRTCPAIFRRALWKERVSAGCSVEGSATFGCEAVLPLRLAG